MASIQETLRAALAADPDLITLVGDRIFCGQIPDDEDAPPWLFYTVPSSDPVAEDLDGEETNVSSQVEFHSLADTYAVAKAIVDRVFVVLNSMRGGTVRLAVWAGDSEESTEEGYHNACRFQVLWVRAGT
ncbi:DUF3168 domain-containing protein [Gemmata sp. JC673]|uniref:DUF3168 domain-containing protein n=1 Tax=Gemmata algarum TaxID=2975278 RepID=A0ABU5ERY8_9BACT|nr:DUF3168 domain-containing protein [Gemmata algarum]MDY3558108.1 DUF3168 domain-containing protein [Gemmata algarum]